MLLDAHGDPELLCCDDDVGGDDDSDDEYTNLYPSLLSCCLLLIYSSPSPSISFLPSPCPCLHDAHYTLIVITLIIHPSIDLSSSLGSHRCSNHSFTKGSHVERELSFSHPE
jgi:hypothetical protein